MRSIGLAELSTGQLVRLAVRDGRFSGTTAAVAAGYVQANLTIVPAAYAQDFRAFCEANTKPCPVLAVGRPGAPSLPTLGQDLDVRTDVPRYLVFEHGIEVGQVSNLRSLWRSDLVAFALGCSFSFDHVLVSAGVPVRHVSRHSNVAMWRTTIPTTPVGPFHGPLVVSMRPMKQKDLERVVQITEVLPTVHGAPIHWGNAAPLGIPDLSRPDYGDDPMLLEPDELPVFWACGVTAQVAVQHARIPFAITHSPGFMLLTDLTIGELGR
jgi:uncharacterized protein YcsI (UPF0317 family)